MAILKLTLKRKWFDLIANGKKKVEYREYKPHWISRLMIDGALRDDFTEVQFRNGYNSDAPFMRVKMDGLFLYKRDFIFPINDEEITADHYFLITLGEILERRIKC